MYKVSDLEFQGHVIEIENFNYTIGFLDPETKPMKNFTKKFGREDQNPGGLQQPPLIANVSRNSLVVRGLKLFNESSGLRRCTESAFQAANEAK